MRPAECQRDATGGQSSVAAIAVDLQRSVGAGEVRDGPFGFAIGCVNVGDAGRIRAAPGSIIPGTGPKLADLGASASGIEYGRRRLDGKEFAPFVEPSQQPFMYWS